MYTTPHLSWTYYRAILQVSGKVARDWYAREAAGQTWGVRTLRRNERFLEGKSPNR